MQDSSQINTDAVFACIPLRLGVFLTAAICFSCSVFYALDPEDFRHDFRDEIGGYDYRSKALLGIAHWIGLFCAFAGVLGCWWQRYSYVLVFALWQGIRLAAWSYMYVRDIRILNDCEAWVNDQAAMEDKYGWNQVMYDISMAAHCPSERSHFFFWSFLYLALFMYMTYSTARYLGVLGRVPKHLLRVDKEMPSGAFYASCSGERAALNGMGAWNKSPGSGMVMPPPGMGPAPGMFPPGMGSMGPPPPGMMAPMGPMGPMGPPPPGMMPMSGPGMPPPGAMGPMGPMGHSMGPPEMPFTPAMGMPQRLP